jgi:hypothetical protein
LFRLNTAAIVESPALPGKANICGKTGDEAKYGQHLPKIVESFSWGRFTLMLENMTTQPSGKTGSSRE